MRNSFTRIAGLAAGFVIAAAALQTHAASAPWKPQKNIEIIVPTSPGSGLDTMARTMDVILREQKIVDTSITVTNRPGGGTSVAQAYLAQRAGDPHVLFMNVPSVLAGHITGNSKTNYTDFTPLAFLATEPIVFVVRSESPIKTGKDLIALLQKDPASTSLAFSTTRGNTAHIAIALAGRGAGIDIRRMKTVVFNSAGDGVAAALGGHVDIVVGTPANMVPLMQAGKVRMIAMTSTERLGGPFKEVPTWKEQGIDAVVTQWRGVLGAKGLTAEQVACWDATLHKLTQTAEWKRYLEKNQFPDAYSDSVATARALKAEYEILKDVLGSLGMAKQPAGSASK
jgi:putative tricarboxylic transport membrane protein